MRKNVLMTEMKKVAMIMKNNVLMKASKEGVDKGEGILMMMKKKLLELVLKLVVS